MMADTGGTDGERGVTESRTFAVFNLFITSRCHLRARYPLYDIAAATTNAVYYYTRSSHRSRPRFVAAEREASAYSSSSGP